MHGETVSQSPGTVCEDASHISPDPVTGENSELPQNFSETFLRNFCLFYLRLQGQLLLRASTILTVVEEMQNLHELGKDYSLSKLHALLKDDMSLTDDDVTKIYDCIRDTDLFSACHQGPLRTTYSRALMFKANTNPEELTQLMKSTFYTQHKQVNQGKNMKYLLEAWPFWFFELGMGVHFKELTGKALKKLHTECEPEGETAPELCEYSLHEQEQEVRAGCNKGENVERWRCERNGPAADGLF